MLATPFKSKINNVTLPVLVASTQLRVVRLDSLQQDVAKHVRIFRRHAQSSCEEASLVSPMFMRWTKAVIAQFANFYSCIFGMRHLHQIIGYR